MIEVVPSINVQTFREIKERIKRVEPYVRWCHIDVTDGVFSKHETWRDSADLSFLDTSLNVEVHLMIQEPEHVIDQWLVKPVKRAIVHVEATDALAEIIQKCRDAGVEIGIAVNPETPWEKLKPWFDKVDIVQVLAVHPGPSGQKMTDASVEKIAAIHSTCPSCTIEIDGGVDFETGKKVVAAGATLLVTGNYLFSANDIEAAIVALKRI